MAQTKEEFICEFVIQLYELAMAQRKIEPSGEPGTVDHAANVGLKAGWDDALKAVTLMLLAELGKEV